MGISWAIALRSCLGKFAQSWGGSGHARGASSGDCLGESLGKPGPIPVAFWRHVRPIACGSPYCDRAICSRVSLGVIDMSLRILAQFCERLGLAQGLAQKAQTWPTVWPREEANPLSNWKHRKKQTHGVLCDCIGKSQEKSCKVLGGY